MSEQTNLENFVKDPADYIRDWLQATYENGPEKVWSKNGQTREEWCYSNFGLSYISIYSIIQRRRGVRFSTFVKICKAQGIKNMPVVYRMLKFAQKLGLSEQMQTDTKCGYIQHFINIKNHTMELNKYISCLYWLHINCECSYGNFLIECSNNFLQV
jgi:hypothetical protein